MGIRFLHTADWQVGKPFGSVEDPQHRAALVRERTEVIGRIGDAARAFEARFVVMAGDFFDSNSALETTVAAACGAVGRIGLPVLVIPGNHDHGGPGTIWRQPFFESMRAELAPNLRVLLAAEPVELDDAVLLPCPLLRRFESTDPAAWLRTMDVAALPEKPRIVLAHGTVLEFGGSAADDDEGESASTNYLDLAQLPMDAIDYVALGDWHGSRAITPKAWYPGTPEPDRFDRGEGYLAGQVLAVEAARGVQPVVTQRHVGRIRWHRLTRTLAEEASLGELRAAVGALLGDRVGADLLALELDGALGLEAMGRLEEMLVQWRARFLRVRLSSAIQVAPTDDEIAALTARPDPLIAAVAADLIDRLARGGDEAAIARIALRELHAVAS